jgi:hypothetical protein
MSPNSKSIAFISDRVDRGKSSIIYLLSINGGEPYPILNFEYKEAISTFKWSPNGRFIAFLSADEMSIERRTKEEKGNDAMVYGEHWDCNRLRYINVSTRDVSVLVSKNAHVNELTRSEDSNHIAYTLQKLPNLGSISQGVKFEQISLSTHTVSFICNFPGWLGSLTWRGKELFFIAGVQESKINSSKMVYKLSLDNSIWSNHAYGVMNDAGDLRLSGGSIWVQVQSGLTDQIHLLDGYKVLYNNTYEIGT